MPTLRFRCCAALLTLIGLCGTTAAQTLQAASNQPTDTSSNPTPPSLQERHPRYRVNPSDMLAISFPLSPEINQNVTVQPDGFIALANVGSVHVQGQTLPEIVATLTKTYAKILHDPIIAVDLTNFQAPQFTVSGQVEKPGQYQLRYDTTVSEGIAVAGGFQPTAKTQVFLFHRVSADWVEVKKLNLKRVLNGKNTSEDVHLQPGDMIFVPETLIATFRKYVPYSTGMFVNPASLF
jgi:protein involved in polysaccharide export with SLBB domain